MTQKIAYIVNQYPKGSHSFIKREILALERQGFEVQRISIRGWDNYLPDPQDVAEREKTRFVLRTNVVRILMSVATHVLFMPARFLDALLLTISMARKSSKSFIFQFIYLAEACVVADWLRERDATHIHSHFATNSASVAMLAGILGRLPFSFTAHGEADIDSSSSVESPEKIHRATFVVAASDFVRSQLCRHIDYRYWRKIHVVRCGLEREFYQPLPDDREITAEPERIVCVGRFSPEKGQMVLIEALRKVLDAGADCKLVLVGDGDMRDEIERQIESLGLATHVELTGWLSSSDVRREILRSRALILPSFAEGLPVVIMEAMALRRPVLATHIAGVPELVKHGETGWLFPPGNVDEMSTAIRMCLSASEETLEEMSNAAYTRATKLHDIDLLARQLGSLYAQSAKHAVPTDEGRTIEAG